MMEENLSRINIAEKIKRLPTLPGVALKLIEMIQNESTGIRDMAGIITSDAALSAKILQIANSPFYGCRERIISIHQALSFLGLNEVNNLALSFTLIKSFPHNEKTGFNPIQFWKDSLVGAIAAELIAKITTYPHIEKAYCVGLLQNIGTLILAQSMPKQYDAVVNAVRSGPDKLYQAEAKQLGVSHLEVGRYVLMNWGYPENVADAVAAHHDFPYTDEVPSSATQMLHRILALSSLVIDLFSEMGGKDSPSMFNRTIHAFGYSKLIDPGYLVTATAERIHKIFPLFEMQVDEKKHIEILEAANSELSSRTRHLLKKLHLQSQTVLQLKEEANIDALTQVNNQRRLMEILNLEIELAVSNGTPLSIFMADIDHFKSVNDFFGHQAGDQALRDIVAHIKKNLRGSDQIARYGGEEFIVLLPETRIEDALQVAERVRQAVAATQIQHNNRIISVTLSLGVAAMDAARRMEAESLIKKADDALYAAKNSGRNRCCVYSQNPASAKAQKTVLVIDDEELVLVTVKAMLGRLGYESMTANCAKEGLDVLSGNRGGFDLVLLDMNIPGINTEDMISVIRSGHPQVRLILSSGYEVKKTIEGSLLQTTEGFLQKPYEMSGLAQAIDSAMQKTPPAGF